MVAGAYASVDVVSMESVLSQSLVGEEFRIDPPDTNRNKVPCMPFLRHSKSSTSHRLVLDLLRTTQQTRPTRGDETGFLSAYCVP